MRLAEIAARRARFKTKAKVPYILARKSRGRGFVLRSLPWYAEAADVEPVQLTEDLAARLEEQVTQLEEKLTKAGRLGLRSSGASSAAFTASHEAGQATKAGEASHLSMHANAARLHGKAAAAAERVGNFSLAKHHRGIKAAHERIAGLEQAPTKRLAWRESPLGRLARWVQFHARRADPAVPVELGFRKKGGEVRRLYGAFGVTRKTKGVGLGYDPKRHGLVMVQDIKKGEPRMVNLAGLLSAKIGGRGRYVRPQDRLKAVQQTLQRLKGESLQEALRDYPLMLSTHAMKLTQAAKRSSNYALKRKLYAAAIKQHARAADAHWQSASGMDVDKYPKLKSDQQRHKKLSRFHQDAVGTLQTALTKSQPSSRMRPFAFARMYGGGESLQEARKGRSARYERIVKALKKRPGVVNPWALARWIEKRRGTV